MQKTKILECEDGIATIPEQHCNKNNRLSGEDRAKLHFRPINPQDMPLIWEFLRKEKGRTTDFSYGGLLMWVDMFKYEYAVYRNTLFIKGVLENDRSQPAFAFPLGELPLKESLEILRSYCHSEGIVPELSAVPEYALDELDKLGILYAELLEDWGDYLYDASMLATLCGKKMGKKRNHVNAFKLHNPDWYTEKLCQNNVEAVLKFMDKYDSEADDTYMTKVESELSRKMIKVVAQGVPVMEGIVLYSSPDEICGVTIGDVRGDTLYVHIEKATREANGSYETINKEFASYMMSRYPEIKYINREDDSGDEGLRKAKESYHPIEKLRKYNVII